MVQASGTTTRITATVPPAWRVQRRVAPTGWRCRPAPGGRGRPSGPRRHKKLRPLLTPNRPVQAAGFRFHAPRRTAIIPDMADVTQVLSAAAQGDPRAAAELLPLVYDELRKLAAQRLAQ